MLRPHREADPSHVVVLATVGAPRPRGRLSRRPRPTPLEPGAAPEAAPVPVTRATIVFAALGDAEGPGDEPLAREALAALNRVVRAHRLAAADPHVREAVPNEVIGLRVGRATGEQAAEGRLGEGRDVPLVPPRRKRAAMLSPVERTAALLAGRDEPLACEELVLRARLDLDAGRPREAALGLDVALHTALAELGRLAGDDRKLGPRIAELRELAPVADALADTARTAAPEGDARGELERVLGRLEALLRARQARHPGA